MLLVTPCIRMHHIHARNVRHVDVPREVALERQGHPVLEDGRGGFDLHGTSRPLGEGG